LIIGFVFQIINFGNCKATEIVSAIAAIVNTARTISTAIATAAGIVSAIAAIVNAARAISTATAAGIVSAIANTARAISAAIAAAGIVSVSVCV